MNSHSTFTKTLVHTLHSPGQKDRVIKTLTYYESDGLWIYVGTSKGEVYALRCDEDSSRAKEQARVKVSSRGKPIKMIKVLPDLKKFSCLKLAYECLEHGGSYPIEINAANEIAVNAFLENKIKFLQISELIKTALNNSKNESFNTIEEILLIDQRARKKAEELLKEFKIA